MKPDQADKLTHQAGQHAQNSLVLVWGPILALFLALFMVLSMAPDPASPVLAETDAASSGYAADGRPILQILYFYNNPCESCTDVADFTSLVNEQAGSLREKLMLQVLPVRMYQAQGQAKLREVLDSYAVSKEHQGHGEYALVGDILLLGSADIEQRLAQSLVQAGLALLDADRPVHPVDPGAASPAAGQSYTLRADGDIWIYYFYTEPCSSCEAVSALIDSTGTQIRIQGPDGSTAMHDIRIVRHNIATPEGLDQAMRFFSAYRVEEALQRVPIIFIGSVVLSGRAAIEASLTQTLDSGAGLYQVVLQDTQDGSGISSLLGSYEWAGVFLTGLINGFNPCSLSLLLFFLSLLMARGISLIRCGLAFLAGKLAAYLLLGTAAYHVLGRLGSWLAPFQSVLRIFLTVLFTVLAVAYFLDFLAARREDYEHIRMQLPAFLRAQNQQWLKRLAGAGHGHWLLLVSFLAGVVISAGEFLCTGQIFLAAILYAVNTAPDSGSQATGFFLVYIAGILLPLLVLLFILNRGKALFLVTEGIRSKMPVIKLVTAAVFAAFAVMALLLF